MSDHLPECCVGGNDCSATACQRCHACCICEQLRACEQRVKRRSGYDDGYAAGVHAASIVVAARVTPCNGLCCQSDNALLNRVLAAIDGLRKKS